MNKLGNKRSILHVVTCGHYISCITAVEGAIVITNGKGGYREARGEVQRLLDEKYVPWCFTSHKVTTIYNNVLCISK